MLLSSSISLVNLISAFSVSLSFNVWVGFDKPLVKEGVFVNLRYTRPNENKMKIPVIKCHWMRRRFLQVFLASFNIDIWSTSCSHKHFRNRQCAYLNLVPDPSRDKLFARHQCLLNFGGKQSQEKPRTFAKLSSFYDGLRRSLLCVGIRP